MSSFADNFSAHAGRNLPLSRFQSGLSSDEVIVEYVCTDDALYALIISRIAASVAKLARRDKMELVVRSFQERIQNPADRAELMRSAAAAYGVLLNPLRGLAGKSRLIIVPDGSLNGVPFDVLVSLAHGAPSPGLIVSFAPSATVLHELKSVRAKTNPDLPLLAVGDVPYEFAGKAVPNPRRSAGIFDARRKPELPPLPASRTEVEDAARIFAPGSVELLGADATEGRFKKEPLERFEIIHLAVHGFADPKDPQRAALLLAPDASEDGFLQPREITRLPIAAKLVVLSACNTASGHSFGEDGIANLARAFLLAGASSVLTTLWSVGDAASSSLMTEFYQNLHAGQDAAAALSHAKQNLIRRFGPNILPTVAAFQLVGDGSVTVRARTNPTAKGAQR